MNKTNKKIAFIINPKAGTKGKGNMVDTIKSLIPKETDYKIIVWDYPSQWPEIKNKIVSGGYDIAVAVGGDGTVNQLAKTLIDTNISLGIIPTGSGNGLARHLMIPLKAENAIKLISSGKEIKIDSCLINDETFFCTSGIGFDAFIGKLFAESKTRGFFTYLKITLSQLINYVPLDYLLTINGQQIQRKAFLITFANASQYGNNAYIAPQADIQDGLIDVCILKPFKIWNVPGIGLKMFNKTVNHSSFVETFKSSTVTIERNLEGPVHFDGEPAMMDTKIQVIVKPASLKVIVPNAEFKIQN